MKTRIGVGLLLAAPLAPLFVEKSRGAKTLAQEKMMGRPLRLPAGKSAMLRARLPTWRLTTR